jgi:hypothetical protein
MESTISIECFKKRLAETIVWCSERTNPDDPAYSLRSNDLRPPGLRLCHNLKTELSEVVEPIVDQRAFWINNWRKNNLDLLVGMAGRLLICTSATESIPDGAVTELSKGFYDEDDMPPWDTWLCYLEEGSAGEGSPSYRTQYLLSWVPAQFVELANIGVETHFMGCMRWALQESTVFTRQLESAGLLT